MSEKDYMVEEPGIPGKATSLWLDTTGPTKFPMLEKDLEVDVAIVGGGFVGLITAFLLTNAGKKVAVLENRMIAGDVTGHTTAKITSQHSLVYYFLLKRFGLEKAKIYARANETAIRTIEATVKEYDIKCDFKNEDSYLYTEDQEILPQIIREAKAAERIGLPATFETRIPLPFHDIKGAVKFAEQAQFHPRKFLIKIAELITEQGGLIFENSRVTGVEDGKVTTEKASIKAKNIIIATNFPIYDKGNYYIKLYPRRSYVLAAELEGVVPKGMYYGIEPQGQFHSLRSQKIGDKELLLIGGETHKSGTERPSEKYKMLEEFAKEKFRIRNIHYHWSTQDSETFDQIPYIGLSPKSQNIYLATGFRGWGMTHSVVSAIILTDIITGKENAWAKLYDPKRLSLRVTWKDYLKFGTSMAKQFVGGRKKPKFEFLTEIKEGEGKVREVEGEETAVYRKSTGEYEYLNPHCTHLGCIVNWNDGEKTWDCPCHGSRYDRHGKVIHSPAKKDLKEKNTPNYVEK